MTRGTSRFAVGLAIVLAACGRPATVVTVKLVDPRRVASPDSTDRVYLVEVRSEPLSLVDRIFAGRGADQPDTIPGIRVLFSPVVVDDSAVVGFWAMGAGGSPAGTFSYDLATRKVSRGPLPVWLQDLAEFSHPALSPDTRHLAYVAYTPEGHQYGIVRRWPDGNVAQRGPGGPRFTYRNPGRASWADNERFNIRYDATVGPYPVQFIMKGNLRDWQALSVDTLPWDGPLPSQVAAAEASDSAVSPPAPPQPTPPAPEAGEDVWARAARNIRYLPPGAYPELPAAFAQELKALGCMVPQSEERANPHVPDNVIRGNFGARGQEDWAVLCSRGGVSTIIVHWGGPAQCPREFRRAGDSGYLQGLGKGRIGFSRGISPRDSYHHYPTEDDTTSVERDVQLPHDGIDDAFQGKASTVYFCRGGKWIALGGAD